MSNSLRERLARLVDPVAFDRATFDAMANVNTRDGDFEARQRQAYTRLDAILAELRQPDDGMPRAEADIVCEIVTPGFRPATSSRATGGEVTILTDALPEPRIGMRVRIDGGPAAGYYEIADDPIDAGRAWRLPLVGLSDAALALDAGGDSRP